MGETEGFVKSAVSILSVAVAAAAVAVAPSAQAKSTQLGNFELLTDRWVNHSWVWTFTYSCGPDCGTFFRANPNGNLFVQAAPRPLESRPWEAEAVLANGRFTIVVDTPDGVRCPGYNLPSHDTYSWDAATYAGTVDVDFPVGCFDAPAGTNTYEFALRRM
jgi:hypothetical protein